MKLIVIDENGDGKEIEFCQKPLDEDILDFPNHSIEETIKMLENALSPKR